MIYARVLNNSCFNHTFLVLPCTDNIKKNSEKKISTNRAVFDFKNYAVERVYSDFLGEGAGMTVVVVVEGFDRDFFKNFFFLLL